MYVIKLNSAILGYVETQEDLDSFISKKTAELTSKLVKSGRVDKVEKDNRIEIIEHRDYFLQWNQPTVIYTLEWEKTRNLMRGRHIEMSKLERNLQPPTRPPSPARRDSGNRPPNNTPTIRRYSYST